MMYKNNLCKKIILASTILCISNSTHSIEQAVKTNSNKAKCCVLAAGIALAVAGHYGKITHLIIGATTLHHILSI